MLEQTLSRKREKERIDMSKIKNEAKIKNKIIVAVREQLEHRALWLYLLRDEARKRGLDPNEFSSAAIRRCGLAQGKNLVKKERQPA